MGTGEFVRVEIITDLKNLLGLKGHNLTERTVGEYVQDFSVAITKARGSITTETQVTDLATAYGDLLIRGAIIACVAGVQENLWTFTVKPEMDRVGPAAFEWNLLIGDRNFPHCQLARECLEMRRSEMAVYLENNRRDVDDDTIKRWQSLPKSPELPQLTFIERTYRYLADDPPHISIIDYEGPLLEMRAIERLVETTKATRLDRAKTNWDAAVKARDAAELNIKNNRDNINSSNVSIVDYQNILARYDGMVGGCNSAIALADAAVKDDDAYAMGAQTLKDQMSQAIKQAGDLNQRATSFLSRPVRLPGFGTFGRMQQRIGQ